MPPIISTFKNQELQKILNTLVGQKVSDINLGVGSFLTIDFGNLISELTPKKGVQITRTFGKWHLWVYTCAWRIDKDKKPLVACEDEQEIIAQRIQVLLETTLTNYEIINTALDTQFHFDNHLTLTLFNIYTSEDTEHWMLFTPEKKVLIIGPGDTWSYELSNPKHKI